MSWFTKKKRVTQDPTAAWARPEMKVTFKAEVMPCTSREERTYTIEKVLPNGRVVLHDFIGEHRQAAFEPINFLREKAAKGQTS